LSKKIRVLVADDDAVVASTTTRALAPHFDCVHPVVHLATLCEALLLHQPNVLLLDLMWDEVSVLTRLPDLIRQHPCVRACMHTNYWSSRLIGDVFTAGAAGYLIKPVTLTVLREAILGVSSGEIFLCDQLIAVPGLMGSIKRGAVPGIPLRVLQKGTTDWERMVTWLQYDLRLSFTESACALEARHGRSKKQIAGLLGCAESTIASHFEDIYKKLRGSGVTNVASLSAVVTESGGRCPQDWGR